MTSTTDLFKNMNRSAEHMAVFSHEIMKIIQDREESSIETRWGTVTSERKIRRDQLFDWDGRGKHRWIEVEVTKITFDLGGEKFILTSTGSKNYYNASYDLSFPRPGTRFEKTSYEITFVTSVGFLDPEVEKKIMTSVMLHHGPDEDCCALSIEGVENFEKEHARDDGVFLAVATKLRLMCQYLQTNGR